MGNAGSHGGSFRCGTPNRRVTDQKWHRKADGIWRKVIDVIFGVIERHKHSSALRRGSECTKQMVKGSLHGLFLGPHARLVRNERIPVDSVRRHHDVVVVASLAALVGLAPIVGAFAAEVVLEEVHYQPFLERGERKVSEQLCEPLVCSGT
jgi:hypothetical protein